jgi:hypothetical protein
MSYDDYEVEYHLTPSGWMVGTSYFYGKAQQEVQPPSDRALTVIRQVAQASGWSREEVSWSTKWESPDTPPDVLKSLIAKYGEHPS